MPARRTVERTSDFLRHVEERYTGREAITLDELMHALKERGFGILLTVFNLPNLLPIPGMTIIGAIPIMFFAVQLMIGLKYPWLPDWLGEKTISHANLKKVIDKIERYLIWAEKFIRPRLLYMSEKNGERLVGAAVFVLAAVFALPIPLGNFFPVMSVLIISIAFFNRDGLAIIMGLITGVFSIIFVTLVAIVMYHSGLKLLGWLGS